MSQRDGRDGSSPLLAALASAPDGLTVEALRGVLGDKYLPKRRLWYALRQLIEDGVVVAQGNTRARVYRLSQPHERAIGQDTVTAPSARVAEAPIIASSAPLADAPHAIFSARSLALMRPQRHPPVGYGRELLDAYRPNETSYLGSTLTAQLGALGARLDSVAPAGTYAKQIYQRLMIDLSWWSSRLEGNTYSLLDTERLLALDEPADEKSALETRMLLNHKEAIRFLVDEPEQLRLDRATLLNLHAFLADGLLPAEHAGRLRALPVNITGASYIPLSIPQVVAECFELMLALAREIKDPLECAFFLSMQLPYLQPFMDVNKRTARLAANIPLIMHNVCPLSFIDVERDDYLRSMLVFYEQRELEPARELFAWAYQRSCERYAVVDRAIISPDSFRLRWHVQLRAGLAHVARELLDHPEHAPEPTVQAWVSAQEEVPKAEHLKLSALILADVATLHEGNFAQARLSPAEFARWEAQRGASKR